MRTRGVRTAPGTPRAALSVMSLGTSEWRGRRENDRVCGPGLNRAGGSGRLLLSLVIQHCLPDSQADRLGYRVPSGQHSAQVLIGHANRVSQPPAWASPHCQDFMRRQNRLAVAMAVQVPQGDPVALWYLSMRVDQPAQRGHADAEPGRELLWHHAGLDHGFPEVSASHVAAPLNWMPYLSA